MDDWDWDEYFLNIAYVVARKSKDRSTQVGAVIVGPQHEIRSTGYNGPCRGEADDDPTIHERPTKYALFEHAERNCLLNCAYCGIPTAGCTMYCTWGPPCADCARAIVQSGVKQLVYHKEFPGSQGWNTSTDIGFSLLSRLGVEVRSWSGVPVINEIRCGGAIHRFTAPPPASPGLVFATWWAACHK
jgi:dCMP deaminase